MADDQFNCPACGGHFHNKQELDEHTQDMHGNQASGQQEHSITCSKCGFKAKATEQMEKHNKEHTGGQQM